MNEYCELLDTFLQISYLRDWSKVYHTKNFSIDLSNEASSLNEPFLCKERVVNEEY